jgi:adenylate kinase
MVRERLREPDVSTGAIFDGFPRTGAQARALDDLLAEFDSELAMVVDFELPIEISRDRLMARQEGRADDKPEVIEKRLRDHKAVEESVMPHYRSKTGLVKTVDANRGITAIYEDVRGLIKSVLN